MLANRPDPAFQPRAAARIIDGYSVGTTMLSDCSEALTKKPQRRNTTVNFQSPNLVWARQMSAMGAALA